MVDNVDSDSGKYPGVSDNNDGFYYDGIRVQAKQRRVTATTTAQIANFSGTTNLSKRKSIMLVALSGSTFFGFDNTDVSIPIATNEKLMLALGEAINVYIKTSSGSRDVIVVEFE